MAKVMVVLGLDGDAADRLLGLPGVLSCAPGVKVRLELTPDDGGESLMLCPFEFQASELSERRSRQWPCLPG